MDEALRMFRVRLALSGLSLRQAREELPHVQELLQSRTHLLAVRTLWEPEFGRAVIEVELEDFEPEKAGAWAEEDLREVVFAEVEDLDRLEIQLVDVQPVA